MNLKQKLAAYNKLKAPQHIEKDLDLLKKKAPEHPVLKSTIRGNRFANEVLRALIDYVDSEKEIVENRRAISRNPLLEFGVTIDRIKEHFSIVTSSEKSNQEKLQAVKAINNLLPIIEESIQKHLPGEIEGFDFELLKEELYIEPNSDTDDLIQEQKEELEAKDETISEHEETIAEQKNEIEEKDEELSELKEKIEESEEVKEKLRSENGLIKADLSTLPYPEKKKILFDLNLDEGLENMKNETITTVLQKKQDELLAASKGGQKKS